MHSCVLCLRKKEDRRGISYHGFPKQPEIRKSWLKFCGMEEPHLKKSYSLCSHHFKDDDLISRTFGLVIKPGAIPCFNSERHKKRYYERNRVEYIDPNLLSQNFQMAHTTADDIYVHNEHNQVFCIKVKEEVDGENLELLDTNYEIKIEPLELSPQVTQKCLQLEETDLFMQNEVNFINIKEQIDYENLVPLDDNHNTEVTSSEINNLHMEVDSINAKEDETEISLALLDKDLYDEETSIPDTEGENGIEEEEGPAKFGVPRYIGDIHPSHLSTPTSAKLVLRMVKATVAKQKLKIKNLQRSNYRLKEEVESLKGVLQHLKNW